MKLIQKFKSGELLENLFIFDILSKLSLFTFSKAADKFSFPNLIFSNLNLFSSSKFDSVGIRLFFFFSVVISFIDDLS